MKNIYLFILVCIFPFVLSAQYTAIPDTNFEQVLIDQGIDTEGTLDGQVLTSDINTVVDLNISNEFITNLTGIENFTALENLNCEFNDLSTLDLTTNTYLKVLNCTHNILTDLNISTNVLLEELYCGNPSLDIGPFNELAVIDVSGNQNLKILDCTLLFNLTDLDLSSNANLESLNVNYCALTDLNLHNNLLLKDLTVTHTYPFMSSPNSNQIQSLDLSQNIALTSVWVEDSLIQELNLKNGTNSILLGVHATQNPNLVCITVDDEVAANAGDYPYSEWSADAHLFYSENCVLGTDSFENTDIDLFPNPITDILYIENVTETIDKIEVLNILAKRVLTKNKDFTQIDFSNYISGVYFVKFYAGTIVVTKKVVKK